MAGDRDIDDLAAGIERHTVRAWNIIEKKFDPAISTDPEQAARRILEPGETLVGKVHVAIVREDEIVWRLEMLEVIPFEEGLRVAEILGR